ncbi:MAG: FAD:protein FMN transferase, partial [Armatimonadota bacterium]
GAVVHSGFSTVMALGKAPNGEPWRVGIKHPREKNNRIAEVSLENQALSTSGDCEQYFEIGGRRFGHVIDPRSGWSVNETLSATVICESAAVSDALSTAAMVLGKTDFDAIIAGEPGIQAIIHPATDMSRPPDAIRKHMI